jgi:exopolyphosphatase / guanosine-5'-triphosphate,3'-diphosphate pyrophosphatase
MGTNERKKAMFAAIDLGSNSFRLHIGVHEGYAMRIVKTARDPIRLGAGLDDHGFLTEPAMQTALECLARFRDILAAYPLDAVRVVATNTLRIAKNAADFLPAAEQAIGYPIEIISGEEEGRLIYMGVASVLEASNERRLVVDIGGGSTELILGKGQQIESVESFGIGTVGQSLSFFSDGRIDAASFDAGVLSARSRFEDQAAAYHPRHWTTAYGSSGTIRAISEAIAKNRFGDGRISRAGMESLKTHLIGCAHVSQVRLAGIKPERVPVMLGGMTILMGLMRELGFDLLHPVDAGLRMGVLRDLQLRASRRDRRDEAAREFLRRFNLDEQRGMRVAQLAGALYESLKPASDAYVKLLRWSALLHEVGLAVSHTGYHKHGAYLTANADIAGFTTREQRAMSTLILAQKGNLKKVDAALPDPDFAKAVLALRLAVTFMHSRMEIDLADLRVKMKNKIELETKGGWMTAHPSVAYWLQREAGFWNEVGVNFVIR